MPHDREDTTPRRSMHYRDPFAERLRRVEIRLHDVELMLVVLGVAIIVCMLIMCFARS
jgi:hypothetical protein